MEFHCILVFVVLQLCFKPIISTSRRFITMNMAYIVQASYEMGVKHIPFQMGTINEELFDFCGPHPVLSLSFNDISAFMIATQLI